MLSFVVYCYAIFNLLPSPPLTLNHVDDLVCDCLLSFSLCLFSVLVREMGVLLAIERLIL